MAHPTTHHYSHDSQVSSAYESTAYQPVNTSATPHVIHEPFKNEGNGPTQYGVGVSDGRPRPLGMRSLRWWIVEISASVVSLASFVAICVVVEHYRGRGLQDVNLPSELNLNGLVALLSTVCRVALMIPVASVISQEVWLWLYGFNGGQTNCHQLRHLALSDEASRSAWGSFIFLLQSRRNWLAYVASLLTLITLVFGTFTQQLLSIRSFPVTDLASMPGSVPRSEYWSSYFGRPSEGALQPPLSLKAATYNGALAASVNPLDSTCPTGNCTWPTTPSLAMCGGCVNSTWVLNCGTNSNVSSSESSALCQYTLPSGETANLTNTAEVGEGISFQVFPSTGSFYNRKRTDILYVANFEVVGAPNNSIVTWSPQRDENNTVAAECALWMCIQAYQTEQVDAAQSQTVVGEYYTVDNSSANNDYVSNITFVNVPSDLNTMSSSAYKVYYPAAMALNEYFETIFNGTIQLNEEAQLPSSDIIAGIWNSSTDLDTWIKSIAAGISGVIRESDTQTPAESNFYQGTGSQLGYDVRWPWIILPAFCVALSLIILVVIIIRTAKSPVRAWKGSALAFLFTDIDPQLRRQVGGSMDEFGGIERVAGKTSVVLEDRGYGNWNIRPA